MNQANQPASARGASAGGDLFPIRTVSELTGVNPITLRAWERRYGLIQPIRKASGHRLYSQEHIDLVNRIVGLVDRGMRIGQVKDALEEELTDSGRDASETEGTWRRYIDHMLASVIRFDEAALEETYAEALSLYPVTVVTDKLLTPLMRDLGRRWESERGSVAEEHFFGFYLRNKLGARFHHRSRVSDGPTLLLACLPGDRHEIGLLLFALAASDAGFRLVMLGADMPIAELPAAARKSGSDAIVLAGLVRPPDAVLKHELPALVAAAGVPVLLGGHASVVACDAVKQAGAEPLGSDIAAAVKRLREVLGRGGQGDG